MLRKILIYGGAILLVALVGIYFYIQSSASKTYDWAMPDLKASTDSAVIARGKYLALGPAHCNSCHIGSFEDLEAAEKGVEVPLKGGMKFPMGPLGTLYTRNLTPDAKTGIGQYSDGQLFRMMRHGIRPNGEASIPLLMPFWKMADEDLIAIVSYLRSTAPVANPVPEPDWSLMGKAIKVMSSTFQPIANPEAPVKAPPMAPTIERGEYLAKYVTNCVGCHTNRDLMTYEAIGPEFAGGMEFEPWKELHVHLKADPDLWTRTPNITPDAGGVLVKYKTKEEFIQRFRTGRIIATSPMDWGPFSRMSDEDLTALWMYLNSLAPVKNDIKEVIFKKG
jgi:mono/diheme cytochrome c family protein